MPTGVYQRQSVHIRFWKLVDKNGPIHPIHGRCWFWIGAVRDSGYGIFVVRQTNRKRTTCSAHRFSWNLRFGGTELCVLHKCDNPLCVRPGHLFVGTRNDNVQDRQRKGRQTKGENHPKAKLTNRQVISIRRSYRKGVRGFGIRLLARKYGVNKNTIHGIVNHQCWRHLPLR